MPVMETHSGVHVTVVEERVGTHGPPLVRRDANTVHVRLAPDEAVVLAAQLLRAYSEQGYTPDGLYLAIELPLQGACIGWYPGDPAVL